MFVSGSANSTDPEIGMSYLVTRCSKVLWKVLRKARGKQNIHSLVTNYNFLNVYMFCPLVNVKSQRVRGRLPENCLLFFAQKRKHLVKWQFVCSSQSFFFFPSNFANRFRNPVGTEMAVYFFCCLDEQIWVGRIINWVPSLPKCRQNQMDDGFVVGTCA